MHTDCFGAHAVERMVGHEQHLRRSKIHCLGPGGVGVEVRLERARLGDRHHARPEVLGAGELHPGLEHVRVAVGQDDQLQPGDLQLLQGLDHVGERGQALDLRYQGTDLVHGVVDRHQVTTRPAGCAV